MNPELEALRGRIVSALQAARKAKETIPQEELEAFVREETGGNFGLKDVFNTNINPRNLARSAIQGAAFNWADEIVGLVSPAAKEEMRLREKLFRDEHPVVDFLAGAAGGIATPALGAAKLGIKGVATAGQAIKAGAAAGAVAGAVGGAGAAESMEEIPGAAAGGAAIGGTIGTVIPSAVAGAKALGPTALGRRFLQRGIEKSGGVQGVRDELARIEAAGRGGEVTLGSVTDKMGSRLDFVANADPETRIAIAARADEMAEGMSARLQSDIISKVNGPTARARAEQLASSKSSWAEEAYGKLREDHAVLFGSDDFQRKMDAILREPKVAEALEEARSVQLIGVTPELGDGFSTLQRLKIRLGSAGRAADRKGDGDLSRRLFEASDFIRDRLRDQVPGYQAVDAEYARRTGLEHAIEAGQEWFKKAGRAEDFRADFAKLTPDERQEFRLGFVSELLSQLENAQTNQNVARRLVKRSTAMNEKLKMLFNDPKKMKEFSDAVEIETQVLRRLAEASGGSPSARRLLEQQINPLEVGGQVVPSVSFGPEWAAAAAARAAMRAVPKAVSRRMSREIGPELLTRGSRNIDGILQQIMDRPLVEMGQRSNVVAPAALSGLLSRYQ